jgi:predicted nuclease of predicted toxin-antitoxin system
MARTTRFHLDECCDPAIANGLRRRDIDVTTLQEAGLIEAEDEQQAEYGFAENRVVLTHDADFLRLQAAGVPHAGIVYRAKDTLSLDEIIKRLVLIWEIYEPEEIVNCVEFL